jgi:hypothetical protein
MSLDFAGVLTSKATNFLERRPMPFLELPFEVYRGLSTAATAQSLSLYKLRHAFPGRMHPGPLHARGRCIPGGPGHRAR